MKHLTKISLLLLFVFFISPETVHAHLIGGNGLTSGFAHPFLGLDHLLAMVAVGIISTQIGGKSIWKIPTTFVSFMIIGALLAINGFGIPITETGIALSVLFLGTIIVFVKNIPINLIMMSVAVFAIFHGHAHGEELPAIAKPTLYATGFVFSTILLHVMGIIIAYYTRKTELKLNILQYAGAGMSVIGLLYFINI